MSNLGLNINKNQLNNIQGLADQVKSSGLTVFCGAGISFNSGLPLANQLIQGILAELGLDKTESHLLVKAKLPFEILVAIVAEISHSFTFLNIYQWVKPNNNHHLLAAMAFQGFQCHQKSRPLCGCLLKTPRAPRI